MFETPIHLARDPARGVWVTIGVIRYRLVNTEMVVEVADGFVNDLATVPRWLRWVVDRQALAAAAVVHDWLLEREGVTDALADAVFYEAARASGVSPVQSLVGYWGVQLGSLARWVRRRLT